MRASWTTPGQDANRRFGIPQAMLFLNPYHSAANAQKLVRAQTGSFADDGRLKESLASCLGTGLGIELSKEPGIRVSFEDNPLGKKAAQQALFAGEGQQLAALLTEDERALAERSVDHAMQLVQHLDPWIASLMRLIVADVVCVRVVGSGGGTASNLLGMIWLSPHPRWTTFDYAECLVHEAVHLNVFLGDMIHGIYVDARRVREPGAHVMSAVRQERRPIDKALHSACVAAALAYFYNSLGDRATADSFIDPLARCVAEMLAVQDEYLAPYGQALVAELGEFLRLHDYDWVRDRIHEPALVDVSSTEHLAGASI